MPSSSLLQALRAEARDAPESGIVEVFNYGRNKPGLIPLWVGEGDLPTPGFIADAAVKSMRDGETFYTYQRGIPELRQALADYHTRVYGGAFAPDRFFITGGGMQAIQIAFRMVAGAGDEVVTASPSWPNIPAAIAVNGAAPILVPMRFGNAGWSLDLDRLFDAVTDRTRAIAINSPSNPTGWTATPEEIRAILEFARHRGLWIVADEVYHRYYFKDARAPSFHDHAAPEDRLLFTNTFSKNFAMTGWRIGWLTAPAELGQVIENLVQYSTSGVAVFMQRAATVALDNGEDFVAAQVARARRSRDIICAGLARTGRARLAEPDGSFYLFFGVDGEADARKLAFRLVDEANVGVAPGDAFGDAGRGFMRLCFARSPDQMEEACARLSRWLQQP